MTEPTEKEVEEKGKTLKTNPKKKEKEKKKKIVEEEEVEIPIIERKLNISTMTTSVEISSQDTDDTFKNMKKIAEEIIDKYK